MPLQWFAGFEAGDLTELLAFTSGVSATAAATRNGNYGCRITVPAGPAGTKYITLANGYDANGAPSATARDAYTVGCGLRVQVLPAIPGTDEYLLFVGADTTHRASLRLGADGTLRLHLGAAGNPATATYGPLTIGQWVYCELVVLPDRYVWRIDGTIVSAGAADVGGTMNKAYLGKYADLAMQGYTVDVDDLYVADDDTTFGPTARVARLNAAADGTETGWDVPTLPPEP